jgi:hypothetical protein
VKSRTGGAVEVVTNLLHFVADDIPQPVDVSFKAKMSTSLEGSRERLDLRTHLLMPLLLMK